MIEIRGLTLYQPHASLVALNAKRWETRGYKVKYRGPLAIHAAKKSPPEFLRLFWEKHFTLTLGAAGYNHWEDLPTSRILCVTSLEDCVPVWNALGDISEEERAFGDYRDGRYAWKLGPVKILMDPIECRGNQGLWRLPDETAWILKGLAE